MSTMFPRLAFSAFVALAAMPVVAQDAQRVSPDRLPSYWTLANTSVDADVPNTGSNLNVPGCTSVTYTIGSDGKTYNAKVAKTVPASDLGPTAVSIVRNFHYRPSGMNRQAQPVSTYYVVQFNMPTDPAERARLTKACDLPGYPG